MRSQIADLKSKLFSGLLSFITRVAFLDTSRFAAKIAQVIKLRTANFATAYYVDMVDDRCVQRENPFDADAETHLADGNRFSCAAVFAGDHNALKNLKTFLVAFLYSHVHFYRVARLKSGNVIS